MNFWNWLFSIPDAHLQAVNAVAIIALTLALALFAGLQWKVTDRQRQLQEKDQQERRELELQQKAAAEDAAYAALWTEWSRLVAEYYMIDGKYAIATLVAGQMSIDAFTIQNPQQLADDLRKLGFPSAVLGVAAMGRIEDARRAFRLIDNLAATMAGGRSRTSEFMRREFMAAADGKVVERFDMAREALREGLLMFDDALKQSDRAYVTRAIRWLAQPRSGFGAGFRAEFGDHVAFAQIGAARMTPNGLVDPLAQPAAPSSLESPDVGSSGGVAKGQS